MKKKKEMVDHRKNAGPGIFSLTKDPLSCTTVYVPAYQHTGQACSMNDILHFRHVNPYLLLHSR